MSKIVAYVASLIEIFSLLLQVVYYCTPGGRGIGEGEGDPLCRLSITASFALLLEPLSQVWLFGWENADIIKKSPPLVGKYRDYKKIPTLLPS